VTVHPCLRDDLVLVEQTYRGEQTWILKDPLSHKYFRFKPLEIMVMQSLDGERTLAEVASALTEEGLPVSEAALGSFVQSLSRMGLLMRSLGERSVLQLERLRAERRQRRKPSLFKGELTRMRWSLGDPDGAFERWMPRLRFFFTPGFFVLSALLFATYLLVIGLKWGDFRGELASLYHPADYTLGKVLVFWGTGLGLIAVHEIGHGVTCKHFGGHVHEMGAMLIYFQPAFYCNVNDAWTFPERSARLWVTAAGSWIQLVLAAVGAIFWWLLTPGTLLSQVALAAVLIGGLTTVIANANPLMPLDGYYALSDWLEIPNLRQRALAHLSWLFKTRLLRLDARMPPSDERERRVFLIYGVLAAAYITVMLVLVASIVYGWAAGTFGIAGGIIVLGVILLMLWPRLRQWARTIRGAAQEARVRWRGSPVFRRLGIGAALLALLLLATPWPVTLSGPFVVAPVRVTRLVAPDSGVIVRVAAREGMQVATGTPLLQVRNFGLEWGGLDAARARDSLARLVRAARAGGDAALAAQLDESQSAADERAVGITSRVRALTLRAPTDGVVLTPRVEEMLGRSVLAGEVLVQLADAGPNEGRLRLDGAGTTLVQPGAPVRLLLDDGRMARGIVTSVASAMTGTGGEARIRIDNTTSWRAGSAGRARVTLRRSTLAGALWWRIRGLVRTDLFL
jgi:putative peptide zinc metalloprotease protein